MSDDMRKVFQENLQYYMQKNGTSQQDLVNALGVSKSTVSDWVHGKNYPRIDVMQRIADYFGIIMNKLTMPNDHLSELSSDESSLIATYRSLTDYGKQLMMDRAAELKVLYGEKSDAARSKKAD